MVIAGLTPREAVRAVEARLSAAGCPDADYDARELFRVAAGRDARLSDRVLTTEEAEKLENLCTRREQREPLQYLCGIWSFLDFDLAVGPGVLCPRADSEVVCETAIELLQQMAKPEPRVLDLCAAPGGKSLTIAEQMQDRGELFSGEAMTGRVKLLKQAFDRCGIERAKPYHGDATILNPAFGLGSFDRVLCDVPCSGLGVIGKKPDIREKTLDGIENLLLTQQKILQNGAKYLAPNGRLVYSTCTVNHHENEAQVRQFLQDNQDFSVIAPQIILSGMRVGEYGTLFLPHETSTDGFFAAILERQKNC